MSCVYYRVCILAPYSPVCSCTGTARLTHQAAVCRVSQIRTLYGTRILTPYTPVFTGTANLTHQAPFASGNCLRTVDNRCKGLATHRIMFMCVEDAHIFYREWRASASCSGHAGHLRKLHTAPGLLPRPNEVW